MEKQSLMGQWVAVEDALPKEGKEVLTFSTMKGSEHYGKSTRCNDASQRAANAQMELNNLKNEINRWERGETFSVRATQIYEGQREAIERLEGRVEWAQHYSYALLAYKNEWNEEQETINQAKDQKSVEWALARQKILLESVFGVIDELVKLAEEGGEGKHA